MLFSLGQATTAKGKAKLKYAYRIIDKWRESIPTNLDRFPKD